MMKLMSRLLILLLLVSSNLIATDVAFDDFMIKLLQNNPEHQELLQRLEEDKAQNGIDNSSKFGNLSVAYKKYDNEIERDEFSSIFEESKINEIDEQWKVELSKKFFPIDFGDFQDQFDSKFDRVKYQQYLELNYEEALEDIFDDMISWFELEEKSKLIQKEIKLLSSEIEVLQALKKDGALKTDKLIKKLKEIDKAKIELNSNKAEIKDYIDIYGEIYSQFHALLSDQLLAQSYSDNTNTDLIEQAITSKLDKDLDKISNSTSFKSITAFFPEISVSLSYNYRNTEQKWNIVEDNDSEFLDRNQIEEYPELEIEMSVPLNLFGNIINKKKQVNSYQKKLELLNQKMVSSWKKYISNRVESYLGAAQSLEYKKQIYELYNKDFMSIENMKNAEPKLLGNNPTEKLMEEEITVSKAYIEYQKSKMELYKELYLINRLEVK